MFLRMSCLAAVVVCAGCMTEIDEPQVDGVGQQLSGGGCDEFQCGTNSPQIAEFTGFWDLNAPPALSVPGQPNNVGLRLVEFTLAGVSYQPSVVRGRLIATRPRTPTVSGTMLIGGSLKLINGSRVFRVYVTDVAYVDSWAQPVSGGHITLETYKLDVAEIVAGLPGDRRALCPRPPG